MARLPDYFRPIAGAVIGGAVTIGLATAANKANIPGLNNPDTVGNVTGIVMTWLFGTAIKQAVNVKINPTNASAPSLAGTVPATVVDKSEGTNNVSK